MDRDTPSCSLELMVTGNDEWTNMFIHTAHKLFNQIDSAKKFNQLYSFIATLPMSSDSNFYLTTYRFWTAFSKLNQSLSPSFLGMLFLVDSTHPAQFSMIQRAVQDLVYLPPFPFRMVVINLEEEGAWPLDDLRIVLRVPPLIPMSACSLADSASLKRVLLDFLAQVLAFGEESGKDESHAS